MFSAYSLFTIGLLVAFAVAADNKECVDNVKKALKCCKRPKQTALDVMSEEIIGKDPSKMESCMKLMGEETPKSTQEALAKIECTAECLLNGTRFMKDDMSLNKEEALKEFKEDPAWQEAATKIAATCDEKASKMKVEGDCKGTIAPFLACFAEQIPKECPLEAGANEAECKAIKLSLENCNFMEVFMATI